ncbi:hypothetical protein Taro_046188 [Colocasia esculenta]|uniref:Uncharacterized protein n=1 Tax=Colocasia esculenta TaxID=4460 RepID=A0A843WRL1_COLES|nr:hypothetical protein [Colocasia esculenta]
MGGCRNKVCIATPHPVAFWGPEAKSLARLPLSLFLSLLLFEGESFSSLRWLELGRAAAARAEHWRVVVGARRRRPWCREDPLWDVVWGTLGCSIPAVGLPANVATAERIATSEKASPQSYVTLSRPGLSRPIFLSRQECCHGALSRRDLGLVAVALTIAMVSRRLRRAQQNLVCLGCFRGHGWRVGVCPRAECALSTFWWEHGRLPPCVQ